MSNSKVSYGIDYSELGKLVQQLEQMDGNVKKASEKALRKSKKHIHSKLGVEMQKHNQSYATVRSLTNDNTVVWLGKTNASIDVGFDISNGGLASVFLLYGTPKMSKDQKLYNAIFGKKTKDEVIDIQRNVFFEEIGKLGG